MNIMATIGAATGALSLAILGLLYTIKQLEKRIEKLEKEECCCDREASAGLPAAYTEEI